MSHEIRTPLNGIVGMIDSAILYRHDKEKLQDCLNKLKRSSLHLQQLVNEVLDLSKIESGKMEVNLGPVNLQQLLSDVIEEFSALAKEKGIGLTQTGKLHHGYVNTDKVKLHEILANPVSYTHLLRVKGFFLLPVFHQFNSNQHTDPSYISNQR